MKEEVNLRSTNSTDSRRRRCRCVVGDTQQHQRYGHSALRTLRLIYLMTWIPQRTTGNDTPHDRTTTETGTDTDRTDWQVDVGCKDRRACNYDPKVTKSLRHSRTTTVAARALQGNCAGKALVDKSCHTTPLHCKQARRQSMAARAMGRYMRGAEAVFTFRWRQLLSVLVSVQGRHARCGVSVFTLLVR